MCDKYEGYYVRGPGALSRVAVAAAGAIKLHLGTCIHTTYLLQSRPFLGSVLLTHISALPILRTPHAMGHGRHKPHAQMPIPVPQPPKITLYYRGRGAYVDRCSSSTLTLQQGDR